MKTLQALRPRAYFVAPLAIAAVVAALATMMMLLLSSAGAAPADTIADRVYGQGGSFTSNGVNLGGRTASSLANPAGVAVDAAGHLYVADYDNNRVLEYDLPLTSSVANRVFGQGGSFTSGVCNLGGVSASRLCGPNGVAVDAAGRLYVADYSNNRVLEYDSPLTSSVASRVFGQGGSFTSQDCNLGGVSASSLCGPTGFALDSAGRLYIADYFNNRVLEYDSPLTSDVADRVFGQGGSVASQDCNPAGVNASSLCNPYEAEVDAAGRLYVSDYANNRVLEYDSPLSSDVADRVFGQGGSFASQDCNLGGVSASTLCGPLGVAVDSTGRLYVADYGNTRVLGYDRPLTSDVANRVFGQGGSFTSGACNLGGVSASSLCNPDGIAVDAAGNLYVGDHSNSRGLEYDSPSGTPTPSPTPTPPVTPTPTPPPDLNHFKCYNVQDGPVGTTVPITFVDQFGTHNQSAQFGLDEFCNPVQKTHNGNVSSITNPDSHITHYTLLPPQPEPVRIVDIQNQFGAQQLVLGDAISFMLPAQKAPHGPPFNLSHFLCYTAVGQPVSQIVDLVDQFHAEPGVQVIQPDLFCNPAEKILFGNDYPLLNPDDHLACYRIVPQAFNTSVTVTDQFYTALSIQILPADELCVPSLKLAVNTPTVVPTPTPTDTPTPVPTDTPTPTPTDTPTPVPTDTPTPAPTHSPTPTFETQAPSFTQTPPPTPTPTPTPSPTPTPTPPVVTFTVYKDFAGDNPAFVSVSLTCTSGTVSGGTQLVSESSPGTWTVTGFTGSPSCTATENPIPTPYLSTGTCTATLAVGHCTIVNYLESSTPTRPPTPTPSATPTPTPTPSPTPTPTLCCATPPPTGPVGGLVDVVTTGGGGGSDSSMLLVLGALLAVAAAGAAVFGFRRASGR